MVSYKSSLILQNRRTTTGTCRRIRRSRKKINILSNINTLRICRILTINSQLILTFSAVTPVVIETMHLKKLLNKKKLIWKENGAMEF